MKMDPVSTTGEQVESNHAVHMTMNKGFQRINRSSAEKMATPPPSTAMLFFQAYYADCLYLDIQPNEKQVEELYRAYEKKYLE